jgi:hypothetical protein
VVEFDMSEACPLSTPSDTANLVLCINEEAAQAHLGLFGLPEHAYATPADNQRASSAVSAVSWLMRRIDDLSLAGRPPDTPKAVHLQVVVDGSGLAALALWSVDEPSPDELLSLLTTAGMAAGEARAITPHGRRRIFASLCHENRVDILRRLCRLVKRKIEDRTRAPGLHVDCHMLAEESKRLVASSL